MPSILKTYKEILRNELKNTKRSSVCTRTRVFLEEKLGSARITLAMQ